MAMITGSNDNRKEWDRLWQIVNTNPTDFVSWTLLLQSCKHMNSIESIREVYNAFLSHYPYCYVYWKKFVEFELQMSNESNAFDVLERAVTSFPISIDIWIYFIQQLIHLNKKDNEIIVLFERAIKLCGNNYNSGDLWSLYVNWLRTRQDLSEVTFLYDRLLEIPVNSLCQHFDDFMSFVNQNNPICILTTKEYNRYNSKYMDLINNNNINSETNEFKKTQENSSHLNGKNLEESDTKIVFIRQMIINERKLIFKSTLKEMEERRYFEDNIKRPYFHVNPLDITQLDNWTKYLNWEISRNNDCNVILLFERCMVSCALYEFMWVRYSNYLIDKRYEMMRTGKEFFENFDINAIRSVFRRATQIHMKKSFKIHNLWALFEEREGNFDEALKILDKFQLDNPYLIESILSKIHLYHRRGDVNQVKDLFQTSIDKFKEYPKLCAHLSIRFSRFLFKVLKDTESAVDVLNSALKTDPNNYIIYLRLIDIEYQKRDINSTKIEHLFDNLIASTQSLALKISMTQRKLEFMQDFGFDCEK
ncbi:unnamed protein product [Oppiella nova]|uniref:Suppressor of forked domain-containing protein n=1 Tax=Oppiella nova TaxID=334625 RepID=A0A7R9Q960_9ACAR|nr:unnamed protein product [Oppiella nova]CAG2159595.1 unnamed protein product [Oppiella nova]